MGSFTPILDFVHALSRVFAGGPHPEGEAVYKRWIQAVWEGVAALILPELHACSEALGPPPTEAAESDPRRLAFEASRHLRNNAQRMSYDEYRRRGLPIMTSASAIKMINRRVKGSEKYWSEPGAAAILQLRADYLSETETMNRFWSAR